MDCEPIRNLRLKEIFVNQGIDRLLQEIDVEGGAFSDIFEMTNRGTVWVTDNAEVGHSIFKCNTSGVDKNKLLVVHNASHKLLFLWHIDGVMYKKLTKCDCAILHERIMHMVEFKANAKNDSDDSIEGNYNKACSQIAITFERFKELYAIHGVDIWDVFDDVDAMVVFDRTVPQNNAYQKSLQKSFLETNHFELSFSNEMNII